MISNSAEVFQGYKGKFSMHCINNCIQWLSCTQLVDFLGCFSDYFFMQ